MNKASSCGKIDERNDPPDSRMVLPNGRFGRRRSFLFAVVLNAAVIFLFTAEAFNWHALRTGWNLRPLQVRVERSDDQPIHEFLRVTAMSPLKASTDLRLINGVWAFPEGQNHGVTEVFITVAASENMGPYRCRISLGETSFFEQTPSQWTETSVRLVRAEEGGTWHRYALEGVIGPGSWMAPSYRECLNWGGDWRIVLYSLGWTSCVLGCLSLLVVFLVRYRRVLVETMRSEVRLLRLFRHLTVATWVGLGASVAIIFWGSYRGFDLADEGYYWLCYTHFDYYGWSHPYAFLGSKLISWLHLNVVTFRWLRFLLLFVSHFLFACAMVRWMEGRVSFAGDRMWLKRFGFALLLSSVTMPYLWAPQTLSYNDWACMLSLVAAALVILVLKQNSERGKGLALRIFVLAAGAGAVLGWLAFVKWPAALAMGALVLLVGLIGLGQRGNALAVYCLALITGMLATLVLIHVGCVDLRVLGRAIVESTSLSAQTSHQPTALLSRYWLEFRVTWLNFIGNFWWVALLLNFWPAIFYQRSSSTTSNFRWVLPVIRIHFTIAWLTSVMRIRWILLIVIAAGVLVLSWKLSFFRAGSVYVIYAMQAHLTLALLTGGLWLGCRLVGGQVKGEGAGLAEQVGWADVRQRLGHWLGWLMPNNGLAVVLLLFGLPWAVAFGTNNRLLMNGAWVGAAWKGLLLIGIGAAWRYRAARMWCLALGALSVVFSFIQFVDGHVSNPYHYPRPLKMPLWHQSFAVTNLPRARGLLFDAKTSNFLSDIAERYQALGLPPDYPIMAIYDYPGLVYLLGGLSPSVPWYPSEWIAPGETLKVLHKGMPMKDQAETSAKPVLLLSQDLDMATTGALATLGIDFPKEYTQIKSLSYPYHGYLKPGPVLWVPNEVMAPSKGKP